MEMHHQNETQGTVESKNDYRNPTIDNLTNKNPAKRRAVVTQLGKKRELSAVNAIIGLLKTEKWHYVRSAAWIALKRISPDIYQKERLKAGSTIKQFLSRNYMNIPWWTGVILWTSPLFVATAIGRANGYRYFTGPYYYPYILPVSIGLMIFGFLFKIIINSVKSRKSQTVR
jgi:hypothetical protein